MPNRSLPRWSLPAVLSGLALGLLPVVTSSPAAAAVGDVRIEVLSGRGDLVTGGDALLRVVLPEGSESEELRVDDDGRDVTNTFVPGEGGVVGLVKGLDDGANVVTAVLADGRGARITVTNAPIGGPVFSGPQIQPWTCSDGAQDTQCNRPPTVELLYQPVTGTPLLAYDPQSPPPVVATTTTDEGHEVPFIVRVETGASVRDEYRIAALADPTAPIEPTKRYAGNNGKLVLTHGASCDTAYAMGAAPDVLLTDALGRGFVVASHALDNAGHNCNLVTQAESLVVTKEMVAERFGPIRYTIGTGCSGGSLVQQQVANAYPDVYQGILPQCSFTDAWSSAQQYIDYVALRAYLEGPGALESLITPAQYLPVFGHPNPANAITFTEVIPNSGNPSRSCPGVPEAQVYDPSSNPDGVRCTLQDYMVNVFGVDEDGKARRPIGGVGIQYGLSGLQDGLLLPSQFVALNAGIGGFDLDLNRIDPRTGADPVGIRRAFRSGAVNTGAHLDQVAIIDLRGPDPGAFHDVYRTSSMTDRLVREHGTSENQVLWEGPVPLIGAATFVDEGIAAMDAWLAVVDADKRDVPLPQKVLDARVKAGVSDRCTDALGIDRPGMDSCVEVDTQVFSSPRIEAGGGADAVGYADDTLACQLMPLEDFDYGSVSFTQAELDRLRSVFPTGVCDYSKPSIGAQDAITWLTYQDADGSVVYGGRPLGAPPASMPFRGASGDGAVPAAGAAGGRLPATGSSVPLGLAALAMLASLCAVPWLRRPRA
jgi:hypothetical protein